MAGFKSYNQLVGGRTRLGFNRLWIWTMIVSTKMGLGKDGKEEQPHLVRFSRAGLMLGHLHLPGKHFRLQFLTYCVLIHLPLRLRHPNYISFQLPQVPHFSSQPIAHSPPFLQQLQSPASACKVYNNGYSGISGSLLISARASKT